MSVSDNLMVSYDVCGLFADIPIHECIDLAVDKTLKYHIKLTFAVCFHQKCFHPSMFHQNDSSVDIEVIRTVFNFIFTL